MADAEVYDQVVRFMNQIPLAKESEDDNLVHQNPNWDSDVSSIGSESQEDEEAQDNGLSALMGLDVSIF